MIRSLLSIILLAGTLPVTAQHFAITGAVKGVSTGKVYLQRFTNKMFFTIDSSNITDGKFHFTKKPQLPELYGITLNPSGNPLYVFLEDKKIEVELDSSQYYSRSVVKGSDAQDLFTAYRNSRNVKVDEFIKANPSSIVAAYVLYRDYSYRLTPEEIDNNVKLLSPSLQKTQYVNVLRELSPTLRKVGIGQPAPDFTLADPEGNAVKFSSHSGAGKYLLLDFWAGWCGPCRRENPNLVRVYEKYKGKGFDIFAVSLDKQREQWLKAIADDKLTWTHVSDLRFWDSAPAKLYGVRAIPSNVLIGPDGKIIARNLRGKELEEKLATLLQ